MGNLSEHKLVQLFESSRMLNAQLDRGELLSLVLAKSMEVTKAVAGTLWLVLDNNSLAPFEIQGIKKELMENMVLIKGEGLAGQVVERNEPKIANDVNGDSGWASRFDQSTGFTTKSILCIPLRADKKVIGCLQLVNKIGGECFTPEDLEVAMFFGGHAAVALENSRLYNENKMLLESAIYALASALDAREPYAHKHSERVTRVSLRIGQAMGFSQEDLKSLEWTALLHDVGKIGISDTVLLQTGLLSKEDWLIIKKHPVIGSRILSEIKPSHLADKISTGVLSHHEWYNGNGYPAGLKNKEIPLFSRIIAVADAYDAITSDRPYRAKSTNAEAIEEINSCIGTQFDPEIVKIFLRVEKE
jgi:HD-GYP domain-containing protein (c-di-GMP phosphodiesterase class II)